MRALAFLFALNVPSLSKEYKDPIREGLFTRRETTFVPPFIARESNKHTHCSFPTLEVEDFKISMI